MTRVSSGALEIVDGGFWSILGLAGRGVAVSYSGIGKQEELTVCGGEAMVPALTLIPGSGSPSMTLTTPGDLPRWLLRYLARSQPDRALPGLHVAGQARRLRRTLRVAGHTFTSQIVNGATGSGYNP